MKLLLMEPVSIWLGDICTLLGHMLSTCQPQSKASVLCQHLFQEQLTDVLSGTGGMSCVETQIVCVCICPEILTIFHGPFVSSYS